MDDRQVAGGIFSDHVNFLQLAVRADAAVLTSSSAALDALDLCMTGRFVKMLCFPTP
jgi:hypothetical protein